jgi:N-acetylmuramoyl-L-alanine amidase
MRIIKLAFILLLISSGLGAQTLDHRELIDRTGARLLWDPLTRKGILIKGKDSVTFFADEHLLLFNGEELFNDAAVVYEKGELRFSGDTSDRISRFFQKKEPVDNTTPFRVAAIILDPGHGGRDAGTSSRFEVDGVPVTFREKNMVLDQALALEQMLKSRYPDKEILLTRRSDIYPTLEERVELANSYKPGPGEGIIYISLHGNASLNTRARGYEVWYLPEDYRRQIVGGGDDDIQPVLNTLMEEEFTLESRKLAGYVLDELEKRFDDPALNRGLKEESWFVVRNAMMASILIESGFISNREETALLRRPEYLKRINDGIYNGIVNFVDFFENRYDE